MVVLGRLLALLGGVVGVGQQVRSDVMLLRPRQVRRWCCLLVGAQQQQADWAGPRLCGGGGGGGMGSNEFE